MVVFSKTYKNSFYFKNSTSIVTYGKCTLMISLPAKQANPAADTAALERQIDELIYGLYGLTEEEIGVIVSQSNIQWIQSTHLRCAI